jgi:hypothetical protein
LKLRIALLLACVALVVPASAQVYSNGPANGTVDAWTINFGYVVSDTFGLSSATTVTGFDFAVWALPGDTPLTVDWSITSGENGGTSYGSGTASLTSSFISSNQYGYDIDKETVSGLNVKLAAGTYWLNLQNAVTSGGNPLYWDENSGVGCKGTGCPSMASESAVGTIPGEAFDIFGGTSSTTGTGTTPEPSSIMLLGSGILGLAGVLRRKLF